MGMLVGNERDTAPFIRFVNDWFRSRSQHSAHDISESGTIHVVRAAGRHPQYSSFLTRGPTCRTGKDHTKR